MNAFELNKFIGAVLAALVFVMGLSVLSDIIFSEHSPETPGYTVAVVAPTPDDEAVEEVPFAVLLATADASAGESASRVCSACHAFDEGGANGIGPALWDIVGRDIAGDDGFSYSTALTAYAADHPVWDYAQLDGFLENPQGWVSGTSMGYAGIKDDKQRADVIAYLRSVSPNAPPLPEAPAVEEVAAVDEGTVTDAAPEAAPAAADPAIPADVTEDATETAPAETAAAPAAAPAEQTFASLVASSDPAAGEAKAAICLACHNAQEGAGNKLGPNLYGVFGREIGVGEGFNYSAAMMNYAAEEGAWNLDNLSAYLEAPMEVVPGTQMAYGGVKDEAERAEILAWLHSISPEAGPIVVAAPAAPAPAEEPVAPAPDLPSTDDAAAAPDAAAEGTDVAAAPATETVAPAQDSAPADEAAAAAAPAAAPAGTEAPADAAAPAATETADAGPSGDTTTVIEPGVNIVPAVPGRVEIVTPPAD